MNRMLDAVSNMHEQVAVPRNGKAARDKNKPKGKRRASLISSEEPSGTQAAVDAGALDETTCNGSGEAGSREERGFSPCSPETAKLAEQFDRQEPTEQRGFSPPAPEIPEFGEKTGCEAARDAVGFSPRTPDAGNFWEQPAAPRKEAPRKEGAGQKNKGGRPRVLDDYARGKMVLALAVGMSQTQVAAWLGCDHKTVALALRTDPRLAEDLEWHKSVVRLHPFLKIYNESASNWKASVWLLEYLDKRHGEMTIDDLMRMLMEMWGLARHTAPPEAFVSPLSCHRPEAAAENEPSVA